METTEEAKEYIGKAIDKLQDADKPIAVTHLETTLTELEKGGLW